MLVGAALFWKILEVVRISLGKGYPILQNTKFGWIVSESAPIQTSILQNRPIKDKQLQNFWELESLRNVSSISSDDIKCEELFHSFMYY